MLLHTRHLDGLEAPRNSLEMPMDAQSSPTKDENIPFSYQITQHFSKTGPYQNGTPVTSPVDWEISKEPQAIQRSPNVVARLMGVDKFPSEIKSPIYEKKGGFSSRIVVETNEVVPKELTPGIEAVFSTRSKESDNSRTISELSRSLVTGHPQEEELQKFKPVVRDHPQEQELQKFKRDFEAWQASRFWESSRSCGFNAIGGFWNDKRTLPQERPNKENRIRYTDAELNTDGKRPEAGSYAPSRSRTSTQGNDFLQINKCESLRAKQMEAWPMLNINRNSNRDRCHVGDLDKQQMNPLSTRIVILKPGPERFDYSDDSQTASGSIFGEDEGSIKDLLEEVKERLICGMKGKDAHDLKWRHDEIIGSSFCRPTNPKEISHQIAKQERSCVTREMISLRSKSQRSSFPMSRPSSPEHIDNDTRRFLSQRMKNMLRNESELHMPRGMKVGSWVKTLSERGVSMEPDFSRTERRPHYLDNVHDASDLKVRSFRYDTNEIHPDGEEESPRNLVRSLSAPVSGTAFGQLLSEDQPFLTRPQIRRKHEIADVSAETRKLKKNKFNFKGTVSNLRYGLTLRGKFFGKKIRTVEHGVDELGLTKVTLPILPVVRNMKVQENSTEVPPSPVSACSDGQEEILSGPTDHSSPISTLDVPFNEDPPASEYFQEICADIQERKPQMNQLGFRRTRQLNEGNSEAESEAAVYLRNILDAARVVEDFDGNSLFRFSSCAPIESRVYEEVEEAYRRQSKHLGSFQDSNGNKIEHRLLFDLLNEVLESQLDSSETPTGPCTISMWLASTLNPRSKQLLADVCATVRMCTRSPSTVNESIDSLMTKDMQTARWMEMMHADLYLIEGDMVKTILDELVEDTVIDLYC